jgi:hypothetical protein
VADYAFLYDRVQMGRRDPQHWSMQVHCERGKPAWYAVDAPRLSSG